MTDLIERLRENVAEVPDTYWPGHMKEYAAEAADEIERLRKGEQREYERANKLQAVVDAVGKFAEGEISDTDLTQVYYAALEDDAS